MKRTLGKPSGRVRAWASLADTERLLRASVLAKTPPLKGPPTKEWTDQHLQPFVSERFRANLFDCVRHYAGLLDHLHVADGWRDGALLSVIGLDSELKFAVVGDGEATPGAPIPLTRALAMCMTRGIQYWEGDAMLHCSGLREDRFCAIVGCVMDCKAIVEMVYG